jgi:hypothetical protein
MFIFLFNIVNIFYKTHKFYSHEDFFFFAFKGCFCTSLEDFFFFTLFKDLSIITPPLFTDEFKEFILKRFLVNPGSNPKFITFFLNSTFFPFA